MFILMSTYGLCYPWTYVSGRLCFPFQIHALLPLLPVMFPVLWKVLNYFGQARLLTAFEICKEQKVTTVTKKSMLLSMNRENCFNRDHTFLVLKFRD